MVDGDTLVLNDGREVRLVGIQAPKLALGRAGVTDWPLARQAKTALEELALGRELALYQGGLAIDRHGRVLAHLVRADGLWLQAEMLRRGLARVYSFADNRALVADMLAIERQARAGKIAIWADPFYRVQPADPELLAPLIGSFQIVEGVVAAVAEARGRWFLNFGPDRKTDVTATIPRAAARLFHEAGIDLAGLAGRSVRMRGWLDDYDGPSLELTHPEAIEVLP